MSGLEEAIALAVAAHRGQKDKAGAPYILHPLRLMLRVEGEEAAMAAVLHDVVEDSDHTLEGLLAMGFSKAVVAAVEALTKREGEDYQEFIERVAANPIARRVKIADLEDNMDIRRLGDPALRDWERMIRYRRAWGRLVAMQALP